MRWNVLVGAMVAVLLVAIALAVVLDRAPVDVPQGGLASPGPVDPAPPAPRPSVVVERTPGATPAARPLAPNVKLPTGSLPQPPLGAPPPPVAPGAESAPGIGGPPPPPPPPVPVGGVAAPASDAGAPFPMTRDGIKAAMRAQVPEIKDCYESWLQMAPETQGTMKVSFRIRPNEDGGPGVVEAVQVLDGGLGHLAMEGCVLNVVQDLRFDTPAGSEPVSVTYPFKFATTGE